jgi:hypothetical protein
VGWYLKKLKKTYFRAHNVAPLYRPKPDEAFILALFSLILILKSSLNPRLHF